MFSTRVICLGCALWDTIFSVDHIPSNGKVLPSMAVQAASGMASAAAITVARLGGAVSLWTRVGDDTTGRMFIDDIGLEGIGAESIRQIPGVRTPISTILVDRDGERLVVPYFDPALDPDPAWLPLHEIETAGAVLCDMRWMEGARAVFAKARQHNVPTILDADVAPVDDLRALIPLADHVLFSEPALRSLVDAPTPEEAVLKIAGEIGARVIGVTLGERGSVIWQRDAANHSARQLRHFPTPRIRAVDTLNAGDIWHGTYAFGLAHGWDLARTVRAASVAAAMKCEVFGGRQGAPRMPQLLGRLAAWDAENQAAL
jgi:sugar/nucleoside kinase (ribokinase family)